MSALFTRTQVGPIPLKHRVVMAPLTRARTAMPGGTPDDLVVEYYRQRASEGGLIISEAVAISASGCGWYGAPGLYNEAQSPGWQQVTNAVHAKGGRIFAQLWHAGRASHVDILGDQPVSASVDPGYWQNDKITIQTGEGWKRPSPHRSLKLNEIDDILQDYVSAAELAKRAGFDGVELHGANGYLPDQFLQDGSNRRTDVYGGSIENRTRFFIEATEALASVFGGDRVGARIAPASTRNRMSESDPRGLFDHLATKLNAFGLAYLHVIEPALADLRGGECHVTSRYLRSVFKGAIIAAGGFSPETALQIVQRHGADLVAFGRLFISNPDLPERMRDGHPLAPCDSETFFTPGPKGYTDYPNFVTPTNA
ncbi:alkene reductase [Mesorhizobium sp.]|uniref:alkene reductase n=1 Tax=Mesorhizobium sp. TaxID=1871066 RepID=UPI000FE60BB2|nr:alkene reductase [Mesorhizobium sp.]RWE79560.1 MAG: alkene reductase [Mesorhizobium sp.]